MLGTGAALLLCSRVGPQPQQTEASEVPRQPEEEPKAVGDTRYDEYQPDDLPPDRPNVRIQSIRETTARQTAGRLRMRPSRSREMMIMSSPRPKADTYSDIGLRNSKETPGFFQGGQVSSSPRFAMNTSASESQPVAFDESNPALAFAAAQRRLLPKRIILVRHGESEANADVSLMRHTPDNLIELTANGTQQALAVGRRVKKVVGDEKVCLVVSPFERTLQTSRNLRLALDESQIVKTSIEPRLREQVSDVNRGYRHQTNLISQAASPGSQGNF